jgi:hypothetical protein
LDFGRGGRESGEKEEAFVGGFHSSSSPSKEDAVAVLALAQDRVVVVGFFVQDGFPSFFRLQLSLSKDTTELPDLIGSGR